MLKTLFAIIVGLSSAQAFAKDLPSDFCLVPDNNPFNGMGRVVVIQDGRGSVHSVFFWHGFPMASHPGDGTPDDMKGHQLVLRPITRLQLGGEVRYDNLTAGFTEGLFSVIVPAQVDDQFDLDFAGFATGSFDIQVGEVEFKDTSKRMAPVSECVSVN